MDGELWVSSAAQTGYETGYKTASVMRSPSDDRHLQDEFWFSLKATGLHPSGAHATVAASMPLQTLR